MCEQCKILFGKRSQRVQGSSKHLIPRHISSLMSKPLTTCTSSALEKKPCRQDEAPPLLLNMLYFSFFWNFKAARVHPDPFWSDLNCTKLTQKVLNTLDCSLTINPKIPVATAAITPDLLSRYLHNPHGSTVRLLNALPAVGSIHLTLDQVEMNRIQCNSDFNVSENGTLKGQ